jgi:tetratricopeptide (TPR) repeat protein
MSDVVIGALILSKFIPSGGRESRNPDEDRRTLSKHLADGDILNALGITALYTRDDDLPTEHIAWFEIAKAECYLRAGKLDDAKSSLHKALEYRALLTSVQVAQALRLKANVLKSLGDASGATGPLMSVSWVTE